MKLLVTGGSGFIGSNFIRYMFKVHPDYHITNIDVLTYAGNLENLAEIDTIANYEFVHADITDRPRMNELFAQGVDFVVHFAAESHVDRSILNPGAFLQTNVIGTQVLLDAARAYGVKKFVLVSTDEVYGSLGETGQFTEQSALAPNSPYSASKASSDLLVRAYHETFGLPMNITRCSNNYGPYQFPEKLIPLMMINALEDKPLPIYGDGLNIRDWLHVDDHCRGIDLVLHHGRDGEVYNIGGSNERTNLEIVRKILHILGKPETLMRFVEDRLGHDRRYAINAKKIRTELGWAPQIPFETGIRQTVQWYIDNRDWWEHVQSGTYRKFYKQQYASRLRDVK